MKTRAELKSLFTKGHRITQAEYQEWLDSIVFKQDQSSNGLPLDFQNIYPTETPSITSGALVLYYNSELSRLAVTTLEGIIVGAFGDDGTFFNISVNEGKGDVTSVNGNKNDVIITTTSISAIPLSSKGVSGGVATLESNGLIPRNQLPDITITDTFVVESVSGLYNSNAQVGDVGVVTNDNESYILKLENPAVSGSWQKLLTPPDLIKSINNKTGIVTLDLQDIYNQSVSGDIILDINKSFKIKANNGDVIFEINNDGATTINSLTPSIIDGGTF